MERNEMKTDAKIDMLHQAGLFGSPMKVRTAAAHHTYSEDEEEDVEMSLVCRHEIYYRLLVHLIFSLDRIRPRG